MSLHLGTRTLQSQRKEHPYGTSFRRTLTRDKGMSKNVTSSVTFNAGTARATGANGDFTNFVAGDPVLIEGSNSNDGEFVITGIDGVNQAYLALDPPPKTEGPVSVQVRTP